jgi:EAL and modified HD-GYP domain-containing signal transduction protein
MPTGRVELNSPLLQMATTRGKLLELMARKLWPIDGDIADRAFTVGIMSLADALFAVPMPDILARVEVADDVRAALLDRQGEFGLMLSVVEQLESADCGKPLTVLLKKLGLTATAMRDIELAAFEWVRGLAHEVH